LNAGINPIPKVKRKSWKASNFDADPTLLNYETEVPFLRIEDKFVKNICSNKFYIHFVSVEDQCVKDSISLHYSPLLTVKGEQKVNFFDFLEY